MSSRIVLITFIGIACLVSSCAISPSYIDPASFSNADSQQVLKKKYNCTDFNSRSKLFTNIVCNDRKHVTYVLGRQLSRYNRDLWESYLIKNLKQSLTDLDLSLNGETEIVVYGVTENLYQNKPYFYADISNDDWAIRFGIPIDPDLWREKVRSEFFLDKTLKQSVLYTGKIILQWKNTKAMQEIRRIIELYPGVKITREQGLTWEVETKLTGLQEFEQEFMSSKYVKKRLRHWLPVKYSFNLAPKLKLLEYGYNDFVK